MKLVKSFLLICAFAITTVFAQDIQSIDKIENFEGDATTWGVVNADASVSPATHYYFYEINNHVLILLATVKADADKVLEMIKDDEAFYTELMAEVEDTSTYTVAVLKRKTIGKGQYEMSSTYKGTAKGVK